MPHGHPSGLPVVASFLTLFLMGAMIALLGPCLPGIAVRTQSRLDQVALLFTFFSAGSLAATLMMARFADRPARHALLAGGSLLLGAMLWLASFSPSLIAIGAAITFAGFGLSSAGISPNAIIADLYRERAPSALNALHTSAGVGAFLSPLAAGLALQAGYDYRLVFRILGALEVLSAGLWLVARPPLPRPTGSLAPLSAIAVLRSLATLVLFAMFYVGAESTLGGWLFTYARQGAFLNDAAAGAVTSLFWLAIIIGRLAAVPLLRRIAGSKALATGLLLGEVALALILLVPLGPVWLFLGTALAGLAFGPIFPTSLAVAGSALPGRVGLTSSLMTAAGSVGAMILPWAGGALIPRWGVTASIGIVAGALVLMLACLRAFVSRRSPATE